MKSARGWLSKIGKVTTLSVFMGLAPVPASRPRVSKWGTYYAKTYKDWKALAEKAAAKHTGTPSTAPLIVMTETVIERARTSSLKFPKGDIDNYVKGPLDALTKAMTVWADDKQIVGLVAFKRFAEPGEEPGTRIDYIELEQA